MAQSMSGPDSSQPNRWGRARSKSPTSNWQQQPWRESQEWQGQPWQSQGWQDWDWQSCQQWHNQCQEWQEWGTGGASGSWGGWSAPAPPNPDRHLYRGVGADKRRKERRELQRQGKEVPPELQPLKISLNKALKRQMHELHTKAREMAQEEDPEKLKKWEEEQSIWLEIVAREEAEKKAASSSKSEDDSKEGDGPKPEEGSRNMPDDGTEHGHWQQGKVQEPVIRNKITKKILFQQGHARNGQRSKAGPWPSHSRDGRRRRRRRRI